METNSAPEPNAQPKRQPLLPSVTDADWRLACEDIVAGLSKHWRFKLTVVGACTVITIVIAWGAFALLRYSTIHELQSAISDEVNKRVDEQFETKTITSLIEAKVAERVEKVTPLEIARLVRQFVDPKLVQLDEKTEAAFADLIEVSNVIGTAIEAQRDTGTRENLETLIRFRDSAASPRVREIARTYFNMLQKAAEDSMDRQGNAYDRDFWEAQLRGSGADLSVPLEEVLAQWATWTLEAPDLRSVTSNFIRLRHVLGKDFRVYDFEQLRKLQRKESVKVK